MKRSHPFDHTLVEETASAVGGNRYVDEISVYAAKKKQRSQRANAAQETIGPTPERLAKAGAYEEILVPIKEDTTRTTQKVGMVRSAFETHKEKLTEEEVTALTKALQDFFLAEHTSSRLTASYGEGTGGSAPGPRHGGVPDRNREAASRVALIRHKFHSEYIRVFDSLVRETKARLQDAGRAHSHWRDEATTKGFGMGLLKATAWRFLEFYLEQRALDGRKVRTEAEVRAALQVWREQRARKER